MYLALMAIGIALAVFSWPNARQVIAPTVVFADLPVLIASASPTVAAGAPAPIVPSQLILSSPILTTAPISTPRASAIHTPVPMATETSAPMITMTHAPASTRVAPDASATSSSPAALPETKVPLWQGRARFGVGEPGYPLTSPVVEQLGIGWYVNWNTSANPSRPGGVEFVQMIRVKHGVLNPPLSTIAVIARSVSGSLWLVGNEPDRATWQDDATPVQYAAAYHQAYRAIKQADQTALVAIAGVIQPTPLRLRYLDAVLAAYQQLYGEAMPVDVWNVHNFILREERGSWGAEIPPGLSDDQGVLYDVDDNDNLEIFKSQILAFRRWMKDRGQRDKPLIVSEYGIAMPPDYGFGPERVIRFLHGTFDFFLSASDPELGYPPDGNRLVQRWCWYSLADTGYPAGNLLDPQTGQVTEVGRAWREYVMRQ